MEAAVKDQKIKKLFKDALRELVISDREVFQKIMVEAFEDVALAHAIGKCRKHKYVPESRIRRILEGSK